MIYLFGEDQIIEELRKFTLLRFNNDLINFKKINNLDELFKYSFSKNDFLIIGDEIQNNILYKKTLKKIAKKTKLFSVSEWYLNKICLISPKLGKKYIHKRYLDAFRKKEYFFKRLADIFLSIFILILSFPILIVIAFLVYINDRGPVFYSQIRTGYLGKEIKIFKFRSMNINAENNYAIWAAKNDPRVTKVGKFIRKTRIDELPQLLSVIKGEMSLIGPRPERPSIEKDLTKYIPNYNLRHFIKPGLSGWAQVNFPYGASINDSYVKLSYDLYYVNNFSVFLDLIIFFKTLILVLTARGSVPDNNCDSFI